MATAERDTFDTAGGRAVRFASQRGRQHNRAPARVLWSFWLVVAGPVGLLSLLLVATVNRVNGISYRRHATLLRRLVPWKWSWPAALLPLVVLLPGRFAHLPLWADVVWLFGGLAAAEVYGVCFHRESRIAGFEPQRLPLDAAPLGARPARTSDRRLHHLVRTQVLYLVPLVVAALIINRSSPVVAWVLVFVFAAKFVAPAWVDYEAYFHWDMHCAILSMPSAPWLTRWWRGVIEWFIGPAIGSLPHFYSVEHLAIHHPENAGPKDTHSPLPYQRTSVLEFCHFAAKTVVILATSVGVIQHRRCDRRQRVQILAGLAVVWLVIIVCIVTARPLGFWLAAAIIYRGTNTAIAQYQWHSLHDGSGSCHPLSTSILWLPSEAPSGTRGPDWPFFDNYHLIHHLHPRAHYSVYPQLVPKEMPRVMSAAGPVLTLDAFPTFFSDLMAQELTRIAASFVTDESAEQRVAIVTERLKPYPEVRSGVALVTETQLGLAADRALSRLWRTIR